MWSVWLRQATGTVWPKSQMALGAVGAQQSQRLKKLSAPLLSLLWLKVEADSRSGTHHTSRARYFKAAFKVSLFSSEFLCHHLGQVHLSGLTWHYIKDHKGIESYRMLDGSFYVVFVNRRADFIFFFIYQWLYVMWRRMDKRIIIVLLLQTRESLICQLIFEWDIFLLTPFIKPWLITSNRINNQVRALNEVQGWFQLYDFRQLAVDLHCGFMWTNFFISVVIFSRNCNV